MQEHFQDIPVVAAGLFSADAEQAIGELTGTGSSGAAMGLFSLTRQFVEIDGATREIRRILGRYAGLREAALPQEPLRRRAETLLVWMNINAIPIAAAAHAGEAAGRAGEAGAALSAQALEMGPENLGDIEQRFQRVAAQLRQIEYDRDCRTPQATHDRDFAEICDRLNDALDRLEALLTSPPAPKQGLPLTMSLF